MAGIHEQLERPGVAHIVQALEAAKSSYLKPFLELSKMIQMGAYISSVHQQSALAVYSSSVL